MDQGLLRIMACPKCRGSLKHERSFLVCGECGLAFPILEGRIPDMLIEDAWLLEKARKAGFGHGMRL